jgi:hypothetical protein
VHGVPHQDQQLAHALDLLAPWQPRLTEPRGLVARVDEVPARPREVDPVPTFSSPKRKRGNLSAGWRRAGRASRSQIEQHRKT